MKYKTTFATVFNGSFLKETQASLENLRKIVPQIDVEKNPDILPVSLSVYVANHVNLNDDAVGTESTLSAYKNFVNKSLNLEHEREDIVGTIVSAHLGTFKEESLLTEDEAKKMDEPFNVMVGGIVWKLVNPYFTKALEESNNSKSKYYKSISASFEIGFDSYHLIVMNGDSKNVKDGEIISNSEEIEKLKGNLRAYGGTGKLPDGRKVYRLIVGDIVPLGAAFTENPAAAVEGVAVNSKETVVVANSENNTNILEEIKEIKEKISQLSKNNVINNVSMSNSTNTTEISNEAKARQDIELIDKAVKEASDKYIKERDEQKALAQSVQEKYDKLFADNEQLVQKFGELEAALAEVKAKEDAREAQAKFDGRMASFDETFELTDEDRSVIASRLKNISDEDYAAFEKDMTVLLKNKNKKTIAAQKEKNKETATASAQEVAEEVVTTATATNDEVPNTTSTEVDLKAKYAAAFKVEDCIVDTRKR